MRGEKITLYIIANHQYGTVWPAKPPQHFSIISRMCFAKVKMLEGGDQFQLFGVKTSPTDTLIGGFARKERIGCDRNSIAAGQSPFDEWGSCKPDGSVLRKFRKDLIIKIFEVIQQFIFGNTQHGIKISIENVLQSTCGVFAFIHRAHALNKRTQHYIRRNAAGQVAD